MKFNIVIFPLSSYTLCFLFHSEADSAQISQSVNQSYICRPHLQCLMCCVVYCSYFMYLSLDWVFADICYVCHCTHSSLL